MQKPLILVLGANPAWQSTLHFPKFLPGEVNRAVSRRDYPSGKGVNFCRAARCLGTAETLLFQFAGGTNGERLLHGLEELGYPHATVRTGAETRRCITCIDDAAHSMTELIEPSEPIAPQEEAEFLAAFGDALPQAAAFAITGSLPDGSSLALYAKAVRLALAHGLPVVIDAVKGIADVLAQKGDITVKINRREFCSLTGQQTLAEAHRRAAELWPGKIFAITDGENPATISRNGIIAECTVPKVERIVSPLGCGDTAAAVYTSGIVNGLPHEEAFRQGLAAASANCLDDQAGHFKLDDFRAFLAQTRQ